MPIKPRLRIAINGFGRIGRNFLRAYIERGGCPCIDIIAINDIADANTLLHLLKYDTTHGKLTNHVGLAENPKQFVLSLDDRQEHIQLYQNKNPQDLPWQKLAVDVVLECTGHFRAYAQAKQHITAGAKQVIIGAAPFDDVDACIVYGVNEHLLSKSLQVISSVSCTTQALVPIIKIIDEAYGIETAMMTEIHAVTADQKVLDQAHRDLRRARASGQNIVPTTSSSLGALQRVLPHMAGKVDGYSIRVPTINVAAIDVTAIVHQAIDVSCVNEMLTHVANTQYANIMQITDEPLVSTDFIHNPASLVVDMLQTKVIGRQLKIYAWYDNEWGYANRLLDMCLYLAGMDNVV